MPYKKLTDNEIIKALECCADEMGCKKDCPFYNDEDGICKGAEGRFEKATLDLINRLQGRVETKCEELEISKAEAYKECIEKVKKLFPSCNEPYQYWEIHEGADNLLKEMVGDTDAKA